MTPRAFHDKLVEYLYEYQEYLLLVKSNGTAVSHYTILHEFVNYLYNYHLISDLSQITVSMANSKFRADYKRRNPETITKETMQGIIKGYFVFLYGKYGIKNEKLMKGFDKK
jgi:hypothetical protein